MNSARREGPRGALDRADRGHAALADPRHVARVQSMGRGRAPARAAEQRAGDERSARDPRFGRGDGTRAVPVAEDRPLHPPPLSISLPAPHHHHEDSINGSQIGHLDRHELRVAERAGPAEEKPGPSAHIAEIVRELGIDAARVDPWSAAEPGENKTSRRLNVQTSGRFARPIHDVDLEVGGRARARRGSSA